MILREGYYYLYIVYSATVSYANSQIKHEHDTHRVTHTLYFATTSVPVLEYSYHVHRHHVNRHKVCQHFMLHYGRDAADL